MGPACGEAAAARAERVLVLDVGGRAASLIARRVRQAQVYSQVVPASTPVAELLALQPKGLILAGEAGLEPDSDTVRLDPELLSSGLPLLAIGAGLLAVLRELGGGLEAAGGLDGPQPVRILHGSDLLHGLEPDEPWTVPVMPAGQRIVPPPGLEVIATAGDRPVAFRHRERPLFGLAVHPGRLAEPPGESLLRNFLFRVCGLQGRWQMRAYLEEQVAALRARIGGERVILGLSGGVDSTVTAALLHRAVGDQLTCIFVDHGLLREGEVEAVREAFRFLGDRLVVVDAAQRFLARLAGVTDPEEKRRRIGNEFIRVFEEEARKLGPVRFLAQGTIYPDVIESGGPGGKDGPVIKSHHNVGGLPERLAMELVEPLRELFKDEVRELGRELGLPPALIDRHPFPGPGLAVRIVGPVEPQALAIVRRADAIVREELERAGLLQDVWQAFAVLTPIRTVGMRDGQRTYGSLVAVRVVHSVDAMTATWVPLPHEVLARISSRITDEIPEVNRVVYDITSKPPGTIEWE